MEKLSCEICGGDICRHQGKYQCVQCGCLYSAEDLQEMLKKNNSNRGSEPGAMPLPDRKKESAAPAGAEKDQEHSPAAGKSRRWVIAAVVLAIFLIALAQVWLNIRTGAEEDTENEVRSVQEIIDSASAAEESEPEQQTEAVPEA